MDAARIVLFINGALVIYPCAVMSMQLHVPELSIIIPAHNEQANLEELLAEVAEVIPKVTNGAEALLVSDHSSDETIAKGQSLAKVYPFLRVADNDGPKGMGNALKFGIRNARGEYVAFVMGDATCPLDALPEMLAMATSQNLDIVIFSRYLRSEDRRNLPLKYKISSWFFRLAARTLVGIRVHDPTDAYRIVRRDFFDKFEIKRGDFSFSAEISIKAWIAGLKIGEYAGKQRLRVFGKSSFVFRNMAGSYTSVVVEGLSSRIRTRLHQVLSQ